MAYNRLGQPAYQGDDYSDADLGYGAHNTHGGAQQGGGGGGGHPASPGGAPMHGYQLEDTHPAYRPHQTPIQMPMASTDRLAAQPTYSVENVHNYPSTEHFDQTQYDQRHHYQMPEGGHYQGGGYQGGYSDQPGGDHVVDPQQHSDTYYQQPYEPNPRDSYGYGQTPVNEHQDGFYNDNDQAPILGGPNSYGPDPTTIPPETPVDRPPTSTPAPSAKPLRRWKTVKNVELFNGNLVLDCPIAPRLLNSVPHAKFPDRDEFTHMRYSAATCDPNDFTRDRFTLRQKLFAKPRTTELFIVVTMYNEDDVLFARTMVGVFKNIAHMCGRSNSKTWGKDAWKKIVVCVVSDGRAKINSRTRAVLAGLGVYQDGIAKNAVNGKPVTAHIYEYTTQVGMELKNNVVSLKPKGDTPVQMVFCLKEKNQKKINSHRWFFQAFGRVLDPHICVLIDAGTKPGKDSIYQLWKAFDLEPMCGGACGEIKVMTNHGINVLKSPLVAAQNFEYKMSNILDKPLESAFGFISVLPGAFSAYRYVALQDDKNGQGPLERYFAGEKLHGGDAGIFTANMYLAEDRILCWELVTKRNCRWVLQYVKSSTGETDVPDAMPEFILQRRRWLNGSFFAAVYAIAHFYQIGRSEHSFGRKFFLIIEFIYQTINMLFAWFALANFFLVFHILTFSLAENDLLGVAGRVLAIIFEWFYLGVLLSCFVLSLGNTPKGNNRLYFSMVIFWAVIMAYLLFASIFITVKSIETQVKTSGFTFGDLFTNALFRTLIISMLSTYVLYIVSSLLFFDPWHLFTSFFQYLLLSPTYINVLNVYAFCNTHDVSWGTKGDVKAEPLPNVTTRPDGKAAVDHPTDDGDLNDLYDRELRSFSSKAPPEVEKQSTEDKQKAYYAGFRSATVLAWIFSNLGLAAVVLNAGGLQTVQTGDSADQTEQQNATIYLAVVLYSVAGLALFRFIGAVYFLLRRLFHGV